MTFSARAFRFIVPALLLLLAARAGAVGAAAAAAAVATSAPAAPDSAAARVYVVTIGPGEEVWEKFGHNMIWVHDPQARAGGTDAAYNWGMFEFGPGFPLRFLAGRLDYWMDAYDAPGIVQTYIDTDRTVVVQELSLAQPRINALIAALERNRLPENKHYAYEYYVDNCSTRVRDALDGAIGGEIRKQLEPLPTRTTYRWHTRRLVRDDWAVDLALQYIEGPWIDRPINAWQETFLPVKLMERLRQVRVDGRPLVVSERTLHTSRTLHERTAPPRRLAAYAIVGVALGAAIAFGARAASRWLRGGAWTVALAWCVIGGVGSLILIYTWFLTRHVPPKWNQNLWQVGPLLLVLLVMIPLRRRPGVARAAMWVALANVGLNVLGITVKVLPIQHQPNADIVALALAMNVGLAAALYRADPFPAGLSPKRAFVR
ncbi:MAG TPA: DUF4105 domain-containing protein [Tepidisphaeraceae bacterium]|nr:DUF4105 domain-containing protein [Tepidisphaeraceae bacterium]